MYCPHRKVVHFSEISADADRLNFPATQGLHLAILLGYSQTSNIFVGNKHFVKIKIFIKNN
jgi:hypothetical protein